MSLFDLQDVCIAIGSLATLDLPMVVDLIVIYGLKGPYFYREVPFSLRNRSEPGTSASKIEKAKIPARPSAAATCGGAPPCRAQAVRRRRTLVLPSRKEACGGRWSHETGGALRRTRVEAAHGAAFAGSPLCITALCRALAVRLPHERRPNVALLVEAFWPTAAAAWMRRLVDDARRSRDVLRVPPRFFFVVAPPPAGRRSGESPAMS
ncbi:hypothetical protein F511_22552 [Dorcoceras hygrometricum]|uniref:Uncharacterized protein n=1 Tax=Dorcoceras hygrometricum TaxID=472368 RepID=A0A2Z7CFM7_9LAMI|nr:hypothetical protein F511_22552 [Dorcoceras hygrometricum]